MHVVKTSGLIVGTFLGPWWKISGRQGLEQAGLNPYFWEWREVVGKLVAP